MQRIPSRLRLLALTVSGALVLGALGPASADEGVRRGPSRAEPSGPRGDRGAGRSSPGLRQPGSGSTSQPQFPQVFGGHRGRSESAPAQPGSSPFQAPTPFSQPSAPRRAEPRAWGNTAPQFGTTVPQGRVFGNRHSAERALGRLRGRQDSGPTFVSPSGTPRSLGGDMSALGSRRSGGTFATPSGTVAPESTVVGPTVTRGGTYLPSTRGPSFGAQRVIGSRRGGSTGLATPYVGSSPGLRQGGVVVHGGIAVHGGGTFGSGSVAYPSTRRGTVALPSTRGGVIATPSHGHIAYGGGVRAYPSSRVYGALSPRSWSLGYSLGRRHHRAWSAGGHGYYVVNTWGPAYDWCLEPVFGFGTVWVADATPYYEDPGYYTDPYGGAVMLPPDPGSYDDGPYDDGSYDGGPYESGPYEEPWDAAAPAVAPQAPSEAGTDDGEATFARGVEAFLDGRHAEAEMLFHLLSLQQPDNGQAWMALMHARFAQAQYDGAAQAIGHAAAVGAFPRGYRFDPQPLYRDGSFPQRLERLQRHLGTYARHTDGWLLLGYFQVALGREAEARAALERVLELRRADPAAIILLDALLPAEVQPPQGAGQDAFPPPSGN